MRPPAIEETASRSGKVISRHGGSPSDGVDENFPETSGRCRARGNLRGRAKSSSKAAGCSGNSVSTQSSKLWLDRFSTSVEPRSITIDYWARFLTF